MIGLRKPRHSDIGKNHATHEAVLFSSLLKRRLDTRFHRHDRSADDQFTKKMAAARMLLTMLDKLPPGIRLGEFLEDNVIIGRYNEFLRLLDDKANYLGYRAPQPVIDDEDTDLAPRRPAPRALESASAK